MDTAARPTGTAATELVGRRVECETLDRLIDAVRAGESRALVMRGEPGVGKTALLDYVVERASGCLVVRATGVQSEMELVFAGLHQLLSPLLDRLPRLPEPQRAALRTAFGTRPGPPPDRFIVGLAALSLLSEVAEEEPLICLVDDEQWLDRASAQALAFVARRLQADSVGLLIAARKASDEVAGLPELVVEGLREDDAGALLDSMLPRPLDERVRDQIVTETHGNPLALAELARGMSRTDMAGGFGLPSAVPLSGRIEATFRRQLATLPLQTRRLLHIAAADPVGDPVLVWRAAERLGITADAATPAIEADLLEMSARVRFRHPLVRSAAYRSASLEERQLAHDVLAHATDPDVDPDRRAWHRAQAAPGPDEDVAQELERSAGRAQARGGLAAAAAFLERAAMLTRDQTRRTHRLLAAAASQRDAGALDAALGLLVSVEAGPLDDLARARLDLLRGQIAVEQRRGSDAGRLLVSAARRLEPLDPCSARETHLEALGSAMTHDLEIPGGVLEAARGARAAPAAPEPPRAVDVLLDALALRGTDGFEAAAPTLARALELLLAIDVRDRDAGRWLRLAGGRAGIVVAVELWDIDAWHALASRQEQRARAGGALVQLQLALSFLARLHILAGELNMAALTVEEDRLIAEATGNLRMGSAHMTLAAWRGHEAPALELIEATSEEAALRGWTSNAYASAVLYNGLGRHDGALDAAWPLFTRDGVGQGTFLVAEVAEAASRTGDMEVLRAAHTWMSERARITPTAWALGIDARIRALLSEGETADRLYRESLAHLGRARLRAESARGHLLYGEWLRRARRRAEAREQLRPAHEMLSAMGIEGFAERARHELLATGETVRKRTVETRDDLTPQELHIALLARDGLSNPEIGTRLFISPRTVKYHLRKVFVKLDISSRTELETALPAGAATTA